MTPTLSSSLPESRRDALRALLVDEVARTTASAPVVHRPERSRLVLAGALTAAVGVTAGAMLLGDPTSPPAYATWTAVPQAAPAPDASASDLEEWASQCADLGVGGIAVGGVPEGRAAADEREVIVDRRGDFVFCVDVSLGSAAPSDPLIALAGLRAEEGNEGNRMWGTVYDQPFAMPGPRGVLVLGGDLTALPREEPGVTSLRAYQLYGLAGDDVTGLDVVLTGGLRITATLHRGVWGVWWPGTKGSPEGSHLEVHSPGGTRTVDPDTAGLPVDRTS